jgi:uncharacterized protein
MTGRITHFEIPYDDGDRARAFYAETFGWNVQHMPDLQYTMASTGPVSEQGMPTEPGYINGGMYDRSGPTAASQSPVITVDCDDIDATLETIEKAGGKTVVGKTPVADMGFAAYFTDTEGNVVGLWQSAPQ